ncbi:hypothetical protein [Thioclava nitratireducens]|nr:hypothetical protein [Thioclava nitratireducens]WGT50156.1 hypothetical protein P0N61_17920 [Thioclava nitratireducens]
MIKKQDVKAVGVVMVGVLLAGFVMYQFRDVSAVAQASNGYK